MVEKGMMADKANGVAIPIHGISVQNVTAVPDPSVTLDYYGKVF
jgi:hypothetical protein